MDRKTIVDELLEIFGDKNPDVNTFFKKTAKRCKKCND
jgi:hypothetical protein